MCNLFFILVYLIKFHMKYNQHTSTNMHRPRQEFLLDESANFNKNNIFCYNMKTFLILEAWFPSSGYATPNVPYNTTSRSAAHCLVYAYVFQFAHPTGTTAGAKRTATARTLLTVTRTRDQNHHVSVNRATTRTKLWGIINVYGVWRQVYYTVAHRQIK